MRVLRRPMVRRSPRLVLALVAAACEPSGVKTPPCLELPLAEGPAVAKVGDVPITVHQIVLRLREQGAAAGKRYEDKQKLRQFIEDQIRFELLVRAALERGLSQDPDVVDTARKVMVRKLLQRDLGPSVFVGEVPEEAIVEYYQQHLDDYQQPEKVRLAHVQLAPTEEGLARARALLTKLKVRTNDRSLFRLLVNQSSVDADTRSNGGELPFKTRDELTETYGPSFATEVIHLGAGDLSATPVQSTRGWHVVRLLARREALARSLDEVRGEIREKLMKGQRAKDFDRYLAEIRQRYPVALYEERLDAVLAEAQGTAEAKNP
jgi:peptidyl-prolyl cis-trans isomerase C